MVGAPVGDRAAAEFPGEAPIGEVVVDATRAERRVVGDERAGAAPTVPVEAGLHGLGGERVGFGGIAEGNIHGGDAAEDAVAHELGGNAEFLG